MIMRECQLDIVQQVGQAGHEEMNSILSETTTRLFSSMGKRATHAVDRLCKRSTPEALALKQAGFIYFMLHSAGIAAAACVGRVGSRTYEPIDEQDLAAFVLSLRTVRRNYVCQLPGTTEGTRPSDTARAFMDTIRSMVEKGGVHGYVERLTTEAEAAEEEEAAAAEEPAAEREETKWPHTTIFPS